MNVFRNMKEHVVLNLSHSTRSYIRPAFQLKLVCHFGFRPVHDNLHAVCDAHVLLITWKREGVRAYTRGIQNSLLHMQHNPFLISTASGLACALHELTELFEAQLAIRVNIDAENRKV